MKKTILLMSLMIASLVISAQEETAKEKKNVFDINVDLMSRYVWRGQILSKSPNIQPLLIWSSNFGLEAGAWGSYSFNGDYAEADLFIKYGIKGFSVTLCDYFVPDESISNNHYFDYSNESTGHQFEAMLAYEGPEKCQIGIIAGTMFYGYDKLQDQMIIDTVESDTTYSYVNAYSTYAEVNYTIRNITVFAGFTPWEGFYGDGPGIVNAGITARKDIKVTDKFSIPTQASLIFNPQKQNIYFMFGFTF